MTYTTTNNKQILFIDAGVADLQSILASLPSGIDYFLLDAHQDGLQQMADVTLLTDFLRICIVILLLLSLSLTSFPSLGREPLIYGTMTYKHPRPLPNHLKMFSRSSAFPITLDKETLLAMQPGDVISLELPSGQWNVVNDHVEVLKNGGVWIGHSETNGNAYRTIFTFGKDKVVGSIGTTTAVYTVRTFKKKIWLVDMSVLRHKFQPPSVERMLPDGEMIIEDEALVSAENVYRLTMPEYIRQGTREFLLWTVPEDIDPNVTAKVRFSANGATFVTLANTRLRTRGVYWTPSVKQITENGVIEICAVPAKNALAVCEQKPVKVIGKYDPEPTGNVPSTEVFKFTAPEYARVGTTQWLLWTSPEDFDPRMTAKVTYSANGSTFVKVNYALLSKRGVFWKPLANQLSENGILKICAPPRPIQCGSLRNVESESDREV